MNRGNDILNDLVSAMRDGKRFYEYAATQIDSPELKTLFLRLAKVKGAIVHGLSNENRAGGEKRAASGTWSGDFGKMYGDVWARLGDRNHAYVTDLEESEDHLLRAFDKAVTDKNISTRASTVIAAFIPEVRSCHYIMRARKRALKKAA